jgi:hypothetical protein
VLLRRVPSKEEALLALAARRELEDRMRRHRWLAMETARKAGASWAEIAAASGMDASAARRLYEQTLGRQEAFGYAEPHRVEPGPPASTRGTSRPSGSPSATRPSVSATRSSPPATTAAWSPPPAPGLETVTAGRSNNTTATGRYDCVPSTAGARSRSQVTTYKSTWPWRMPSPSTEAKA